MRCKRVTVASTKKTANRINQIQMSFESALEEKSASVPSMKPRNPLPTSPMKIFAGGQFQTRKPRLAAASIDESSTTSGNPPLSKRTAPSPLTQTASTPASPSIPSMKLKRFVSHTNATTSAHLRAQPQTSESPLKCAEGIASTHQTAHAEARE